MVVKFTTENPSYTINIHVYPYYITFLVTSTGTVPSETLRKYADQPVSLPTGQRYGSGIFITNSNFSHFRSRIQGQKATGSQIRN
jgi:hypothetical protein